MRFTGTEKPEIPLQRTVREDQEHMPEFAKWNTKFTISMEELETKLEEKYGNIGFSRQRAFMSEIRQKRTICAGNQRLLL